METFPTLTRRSALGHPRPVVLDSGVASMRLGNGLLRTRDELGQAIAAYDDLRPYAPAADATAFDAFYTANRAALFYWTHPVTSTTYVVRFDPENPPQVTPRNDAEEYYDITYRVLPQTPPEVVT